MAVTRGGAPVVVVGAGLSGLSCALHLLGAGREVVVLEREAHPGGRAGRMADAQLASSRRTSGMSRPSSQTTGSVPSWP